MLHSSDGSASLVNAGVGDEATVPVALEHGALASRSASLRQREVVLVISLRLNCQDTVTGSTVFATSSR